jgi:hypothetical protein
MVVSLKCINQFVYIITVVYLYCNATRFADELSLSGIGEYQSK